MGYIVLAPVGDNPKALFVGMKQFPTEKVILITPKSKINSANELSKKLEEFTIDAEIIEIGDKALIDMFAVFGRVCAKYNHDDLLVNVATGDRMTSCAALSAAYANGLKAIGVDGKDVMLLPIMKLSYYDQLSQKKLEILNALSREKYISFKELTKTLNMASPLLWYHIHGSGVYKGLQDFRLVETKEEDGMRAVRLSEMGAILLKGYIKQPKDYC